MSEKIKFGIAPTFHESSTWRELEFSLGEGARAVDAVIECRYNWLARLGPRAELSEIIVSPSDYLKIKYELLEHYPRLEQLDAFQKEPNSIVVGGHIEIKPGLTKKPVPVFPDGLPPLGAWLEQLDAEGESDD